MTSSSPRSRPAQGRWGDAASFHRPQLRARRTNAFIRKYIFPGGYIRACRKCSRDRTGRPLCDGIENSSPASRGNVGGLAGSASWRAGRKAKNLDDERLAGRGRSTSPVGDRCSGRRTHGDEDRDRKASGSRAETRDYIEASGRRSFAAEAASLPKIRHAAGVTLRRPRQTGTARPVAVEAARAGRRRYRRPCSRRPRNAHRRWRRRCSPRLRASRPR